MHKNHEQILSGQNQARCGWTVLEEEKLFELHNENGNQWIQIGRHLGKSGNCVKNYYHSKLRRSVRAVNRVIETKLKGQFKLIKYQLISKMIKTTEKTRQNKYLPPDIVCFAKSTPRSQIELKNILLGDKSAQIQCNITIKDQVRTLLRQLQHFTQLYKQFKGKMKQISKQRQPLFISEEKVKDQVSNSYQHQIMAQNYYSSSFYEMQKYMMIQPLMNPLLANYNLIGAPFGTMFGITDNLGIFPGNIAFFSNPQNPQPRYQSMFETSNVKFEQKQPSLEKKETNYE